MTQDEPTSPVHLHPWEDARLETWLLLASVAWTVTEQHFRSPNRCVLQSRLLIELAKQVPALAAAKPKAHGVAVLAGNAGFYEHVVSGKGGPLPEEAWSVGVDPREPAAPGRFPGHLVILDGPLLIDGSVAQLSRPQRGIHLSRPVVAPLCVGWPEAPMVLRDDCDGVLMYTAMKTSGWQHARDWRTPPRDLVRDVLEEWTNAGLDQL